MRQVGLAECGGGPGGGAGRGAVAPGQRIAVIGGGIAGLSAAWLLSRRHEVTLFERNTYPGGHSNTVEVPGSRAQDAVPVDTGFIVFNDRNYPNLTALFGHLGVATRASDMSFAVSVGGGRLEYSGCGLAGLFAQRRNLLRPSFLGMVREIPRFFRAARALLAAAPDGGPSLGEWLARERFSRRFATDHLLPMGAAIWSCPMRAMLSFPAVSFLRFFANHGLLDLSGRPRWRTVEGGSRTYVRELTAPLGGRLHLAAPVLAVRREAGRVRLRLADGSDVPFDQVVVATHADEALGLLADPTPEERRSLGAFDYQRNLAILHRDPALMPRRRRAWASWNALAAGTPEDMDRPVAVTYWMNRLQGIDPGNPLFVSLNPLAPPQAGLEIDRFVYHHPVFDAGALAAQDRLPSLQGRRNTWFCGSYFGHGFHEDALSAGLAVAAALGVPRPWATAAGDPSGATLQTLPTAFPAPAAG